MCFVWISAHYVMAILVQLEESKFHFVTVSVQNGRKVPNLIIIFVHFVPPSPTLYPI